MIVEIGERAGRDYVGLPERETFRTVRVTNQRFE